MNIPIFELERTQSLYENTVPLNLTESGFSPYKLKELLSTAEIQALREIPLGYGQTNGSIPLRRTIAALYTHCDEDSILVTNGSAEANFIACHALLKRGDEIVMMMPNYMQIWGIALEMGCKPLKFHLKGERGWKPDLAELESVITPKTKMIAVCNPNNPTGYVLDIAEMKEIVKLAERLGCWIYADEVYRGADLDGLEKPSFYGLYDKVIVSGGLSKAYALPGLRLGWLAGPKKIINDAWSYSDYTSITTGLLSQKIAEIALQPKKRKAILHRNITMLNENLQHTIAWVKTYGDAMKFIPPKAGGMVFIHYTFPINSTELADWLRREKGIFIVAGDMYNMDHYFRLGIGIATPELLEGYAILTAALKERWEQGCH